MSIEEKLIEDGWELLDCSCEYAEIEFAYSKQFNQSHPLDTVEHISSLFLTTTSGEPGWWLHCEEINSGVISWFPIFDQAYTAATAIIAGRGVK